MIVDKYARLDQSASNPIIKRLIIGYVCQVILYGLIITYCVLSPSLFSAIAQLFMLVSFALTIATPYYLSKQDGKSNRVLIVAYPVQRIIYAIFLALQVAFFIYKAICFARGSYNKYPREQKEFFEVQNAFNVYLPILLWPFTVGAALISTQTKTLNDFQLNISKAVKVPLFLALGVLILLIQIFSISVAGFLFFLCLLALFSQRKLQFTSRLTWAVVIIIHVLTLSYLLANFLMSTSYLTYLQDTNIYRFYGADALNNFMAYSSSKGYYLCLILLFLLICLLQRIFVYNRFWLIADKEFKPDQLGNSDMTETFRELGGRTADPLFQHQKVRQYSLKQLEMQEMNESRLQIEESRADIDGSPRHRPEQVRTDTKKSIDVHNEISISHSLLKSQLSSQSKGKGQIIFDGVLWAINGAVSFLTSAGFLLRVTEILSIVVIQRYNNIYSFVAVFWLAMVATFDNVKVIFYLSSWLLLPVELANFVIMYGYNANESPYRYLQNLEIYGFLQMEKQPLDIIIFNVYIFYIFTYLLAANHEPGRASQPPGNYKPGYGVMLLAFLCRYTYLLPLLAIFFLGFSVVNLMNFIYIILFLVFFSAGENVIIESSVRNGRTVSKLTTFSRKYWYLIVYYTLICIITKYCYFLFFDGQAQVPLRPTGIGTVYDWAFNFSLSHVCHSNTTPLFLIFILAEIQIIIYRSSVYLNYSFSLLSTVGDSLATNQLSWKKRVLKNVGQCILSFYYQSLYYITGIIVLICISFNWDFAGLLTTILTCYGLLRGFSKKILALIVFLDLGFLILNYLALFFTYKVVHNTVGPDITDFVEKLSLLIGLQMKEHTQLSYVFALDIVIFYFAVQSYRLKKILDENRFDEQGNINNSPSSRQQGNDSNSQSDSQPDPQSVFDRQTVIEEQHNQAQFAQIYNKGVILTTKKFYATNLCKKYAWFNIVCRVFSIFIFEAVTVMVLIFSLYFRLSVIMFMYLCIYMLYYFCVFNEIGSQFESLGYHERIESELAKFCVKQAILLERQQPQSMITGEQATDSLLNFIKQTRSLGLACRLKWKKKIWFISTTLSTFAVVLTFAAQFIVQQYYEEYIKLWWTADLKQLLFVVGVSVQKDLSFARQGYFYYLMVFAAIAQKLLLAYEEQANKTERIDKAICNNEQLVTYSVADPQEFINLQCDFMEEVDTMQQLDAQYQDHNKAKLDDPDYSSPDNSKQANLLIYFNYKQTQILINLIYGLFTALLRFYLVIMLLNLYDKSNIFAFAYLFAVLYFWFQTAKFKMVVDINKAAIIILILEYLVLLLDINADTSPLPVPSQNLSVLQLIINNPKWIDYLLFDSKSTSVILAFLISSIVIFMTELYFSLFYYIMVYAVHLLVEIYARYQYIRQVLTKMPASDTIYLNYENYKSLGYRVMNISYELLISNSYIFVAFFVLGLLSNAHNYIDIVLVVSVSVYLYLAIFTNFSSHEKFFARTSIFLSVIRVVLFLAILVSTISYLPFFAQTNRYVQSVQKLSTISQIFLLYFIQLWLDLHESSSFSDTITGYMKRVKYREAVLIKCLAYQDNEDLLKRLAHSYKQIMRFQVNLEDALNILDEWHRNMYKEKKMEFEKVKAHSAPLSLTILKEEIREEVAAEKEEEQDTGVRLRAYIDEHINMTIKLRYYDIAKYIVQCNHRIIAPEHHHIDIWDYVLESYEVLSHKIDEADEQLAKITKQVQAEVFGNRMNKLDQIKKSRYSDEQFNMKKQCAVNVSTPAKLFLDLSSRPESWPKVFIDFIFSNFSYFLSFFLWVYYLINPCLMSLPLLVYMFSFETISTRKHTHLLQIYIFLIIIIALCVQHAEQYTDSDWIKYLFYQTSTKQYNFSIDYLFFLSILIFVNQQKIKYEGNKSTTLNSAECNLKGVLRMLINSDTNSVTNLWKMKIDEEYQQKQCNPMQYFANKIQNNPKHLAMQPQPSFFDEMVSGKTGIDFYPFIASVQILITIYLIFLYSFMVSSESQSLQNSIKYFQFSGDMVLAVLANVSVIVLERYITLMEDQKRKIRIKYWFTMAILAAFLIFIYYIAPTSTILKGVYSPRPCLLIFSFIYFLYFLLSGLQIRFGYKKYKSLNSIMTRRRTLNNLILLGFINIPFLYELKTIMDWSFCQSSLAIFDWFRLFSIYSSAFSAKMQYYASTSATLGDSNGIVAKIVGWISFIAILVIIFGPMILFSGLNPIAQNNLVIGGSMSLGIQIVNRNFYQLYSTSHFSSPAQSYNVSTFYSSPENFSQVPLLQLLSDSDITNQFQLVQFQPFSDTNWGISNPLLQNLVTQLQQALQDTNQSSDSATEFQIVVKYQLIRSVAQTTAQMSKLVYKLNQTDLSNLNRTFTTCNQSTHISNLYISLIRQDTIGTTYKPRIISYTNAEGQNPYQEGVQLTLFCGQGNSTFDTNDVFWAVNTTDKSSGSQKKSSKGLFFNVLCDKYQNLIAGLGFTALYTSVILVVARLIRTSFTSDLSRIPYYMNPKPDNILQISEAIGTLRLRKQFREEYLMYYELIDIIRSPDMIKYLSGSFPILIEQANEKRRRQELEKEAVHRKHKIQ